MLWVLKFNNTIKVLIAVIFLYSSTATTNLIQDNKIRLGMSIESVCDLTAFSTNLVEDPCLGYFREFLSKGAVILYNSNNSVFLVFSGITNSQFRRSGGRNSELVLIASSIEEAEFFITNIL